MPESTKVLRQQNGTTEPESKPASGKQHPMMLSYSGMLELTLWLQTLCTNYLFIGLYVSLNYNLKPKFSVGQELNYNGIVGFFFIPTIAETKKTQTVA